MGNGIIRHHFTFHELVLGTKLQQKAYLSSAKTAFHQHCRRLSSYWQLLLLLLLICS